MGSQPDSLPRRAGLVGACACHSKTSHESPNGGPRGMLLCLLAAPCALRRGNHLEGVRVEALLIPALEGAEGIAAAQLVFAQRFLLNEVRGRL